MARPRPDYAIMKRRAEEDRIAGHVAAAREKDKAMTMAVFEQRTGARIERRRADERVRRAKAEIDADLDRRRRKCVAGRLPTLPPPQRVGSRRRGSKGAAALRLRAAGARGAPAPSAPRRLRSDPMSRLAPPKHNVRHTSLF